MFFATVRSLIALPLILSSAAVGAVERTQDGSGDTVLIPFINTANGWNTYVNASPLFSGGDTAQVIKIRLLDGVSGLVTDSFNAYLSSGENLRLAFAQTGGSEAIMRVAESGCVVSSDGTFGNAGTNFSVATQVGMVELYSVSVRELPPENVISESSCAELAARWDAGGNWAQDPLAGLEQVLPKPRIVAHFDLVNVSSGLSSELPGVGLADVMDVVPHTSPEDGSPNLEDAAPTAVINGESFEPESGDGIDAVALVLSTYEGTMTNDIVLGAGVDAATDWIVSFPLRGYRNYGGSETQFEDGVRFCSENQVSDGGLGTFTAPERQFWLFRGNGAVSGSFNDISPAPVFSYSGFLCHPVNVISFGDGDSVFVEEGSLVHERIAATSTALNLTTDSITAQYSFSDGQSEPGVNDGRPVIAYRATVFVNGTLEGSSVLANYMFMKPHLIQ